MVSRNSHRNVIPKETIDGTATVPYPASRSALSPIRLERSGTQEVTQNHDEERLGHRRPHPRLLCFFACACPQRFRPRRADFPSRRGYISHAQGNRRGGSSRWLASTG